MKIVFPFKALKRGSSLPRDCSAVSLNFARTINRATWLTARKWSPSIQPRPFRFTYCLCGAEIITRWLACCQAIAATSHRGLYDCCTRPHHLLIKAGEAAQRDENSSHSGEEFPLKTCTHVSNLPVAFFFSFQGHYSTAQTRAGAVMWGQAVTFCSGHKSARLYKSGGSRVMRREGGEQTQGQGPDTRQSPAEKRPCQLARLPRGSRCSVAADKRKWDFRWPPLSWRPAWDVKTNDGERQARLV